MEDFQKYINLIIEKSEEQGYLYNKYVYRIGKYYINIWKDGDKYFDGLQFQKKNDITWIWSTPKEFYETYLDNKDLEFIHYKLRFYGEPKLDKPKELKGIKQSFSVDYILKKCKCQCFIKNDDIWVLHKDYFSPSMDLPPEDQGMPLEMLCKKYLDKDKKKKFIYGDAWGDIVLRNECWVQIKNLVHRIKRGDFELDILNNILRQQEKVCKFKINELCSSDMEKFWEKVIKETKKYVMSESTTHKKQIKKIIK